MANVVVTQLIVDAKGAEKGVADFETTMQRAKAASEGAGGAVASSFERTQQRWQKALAATDPVMRAQIQMQQAMARQQAINTDAVKLGIATQQQAAAQLDAVRSKYDGIITKIRQHNDEQTKATSILGGLSNAFGVVTRVAGVFGLALGVGAIVNFGKEIFNSAASLDEQAEQVGISTVALQAYRAALLQNGIDQAATDSLLQHLTRSMGEALNATGAQRTAFVQLGLSAKDLAGGPDTVIPMVAAGLLGIQSASQRAQIEVDLFGKSGQKLESALRTLADPTADLIAKQTALQQVMGTDLTNAADKAADDMVASWKKIQVGIAPIVVALTEGIAGLVDEIAGIASLPGAVFSAAAAAKNHSSDWKIPTTPNNGQSNGISIDNISGSVANDNGSGLFSGSIPYASVTNQPQKTTTDVFDPAAWQKYLADRAEEARMIQLSASEQAAEREAIAQSVEKQTINGAAAADINKTYSFALQTLTSQELSHARSTGLLGEQAKAAKKVSDADAQAAKSAALRTQQLDVGTKAALEMADAWLRGSDAAMQATAMQKALTESVKNGADVTLRARQDLEKAVADQVVGAARSVSTLNTQTDAQTAANAAVAAGTISYGQVNAYVSQYIQNADMQSLKNAALETGNQKLIDSVDKVAAAYKIANDRSFASRDTDTIQQAIAAQQEQLKLVGMTADQRDRESAVMQLQHQLSTTLAIDDANRLRNLIAQNQMVQQINQAVDSITTPVEEFPETFITDAEISAEIGAELERIVA